MTDFINAEQAEFALGDWVTKTVASQLKTLLEEKHLYQSFVVDFEKTRDGLLSRVVGDYDTKRFREYAYQFTVKLTIAIKDVTNDGLLKFFSGYGMDAWISR